MSATHFDTLYRGEATAVHSRAGNAISCKGPCGLRHYSEVSSSASLTGLHLYTGSLS